MKTKYFVIIDEKKYAVGYPKCAGCEHLCFPGPLTCDYKTETDQCEYPKERVDAEEKYG